MRVCIKCKKREGAWWDHVCKICRDRPEGEKEAIEYDKRNTFEDKPSLQKTELPKNERRYNKLSIIALIISLTSILGIGLAGLIGFILGIIVLIQIKYTQQKGKGLAITAIVIGFIWSFVTGFINQLIEAGF